MKTYNKLKNYSESIQYCFQIDAVKSIGTHNHVRDALYGMACRSRTDLSGYTHNDGFDWIFPCAQPALAAFNVTLAPTSHGFTAFIV